MGTGSNCGRLMLGQGGAPPSGLGARAAPPGGVPGGTWALAGSCCPEGGARPGGLSLVGQLFFQVRPGLGPDEGWARPSDARCLPLLSPPSREGTLGSFTLWPRLQVTQHRGGAGSGGQVREEAGLQVGVEPQGPKQGEGLVGGSKATCQMPRGRVSSPKSGAAL